MYENRLVIGIDGVFEETTTLLFTLGSSLKFFVNITDS